MTRPDWVRVSLTAGRRVVLPAVAMLCLGLIPSPVLAHALLVSLEPRDGELLKVAPSSVRLTFNEPVGLGPDGLRVVGSDGSEQDVEPEAVDGALVEQPLPALEDGWYVVTWGIVSEDGHVIRNASVFGVGDVADAARPAVETSDLSLLSAVTRALSDIGALIAAGAWAAWWLFGARRPAVRRLATATATVALGATLVWAIVGWLEGGTAWLESAAALAGVVRIPLLAIGIAFATASPLLAALGSIGASFTLVGGGHAGEPAEMVLELVHLGAAAVWLGAAPAVLVVLRDPGLADADALTVVRRFSRMAAFALIAVAVAGGVLAWQLSDGLAAGLRDRWVLTLGAKVALVAVAVAFGALGRRHLARDPIRSRLGRLFLVDAALLLGVLTLSSMLTLASPDPGHAAHGSVGSERCAAVVGDASVAIIADPARTGSNTITITGLPAGLEEVTLHLRHRRTAGAALPSVAEPSATDWVAQVVLPLDGSWDIEVAARIDSFTEARGSCRLGITA